MNQIKIFDGKGNLKEIIPGDVVARNFWEKEGVNAKNSLRGGTYEGGTLICKICKMVVTKLTPRQIYCSSTPGRRSICASRAYRERLKVAPVEKVCMLCLKVFMGSPQRQYCNDPCRHNGIEVRKQKRKAEREKNA